MFLIQNFCCLYVFSKHETILKKWILKIQCKTKAKMDFNFPFSKQDKYYKNKTTTIINNLSSFTITGALTRRLLRSTMWRNVCWTIFGEAALVTSNSSKWTVAQQLQVFFAQTHSHSRCSQQLSMHDICHVAWFSIVSFY